jgi:DNA-directed RNA polymerase subunit RPC12/RpoP|tara:strand:- start:104 stop:376 length:273 start_codon:yes stop_codon:yes gene_type:complete
LTKVKRVIRMGSAAGSSREDPMSKWGPDDYERALFATYAMTRDGMKPACYKCDGQGFTERDEEGVEIDCPYCRGSGVQREKPRACTDDDD